MAEAMVSGFVQSGKVAADDIIVTNRSNHERLVELKMKYGVKAISKDELDYENIDIFVLAMKPKDIDGVLTELSEKLSPNQLLISILAGISTSYMESKLTDGQQVVRVMPNTSSMIRESATAVSGGEHASENQISMTKELMECIGKAYVIDEQNMDVYTGIAGSGPAYFYNLMEHIEEIGSQEGLDREIAREIGAQTLLGAAKMILEQDITPTKLRENVTSPNGTTAAGLDALNQHGGGKAMMEAIKSATARSIELRKELEKGLTTQK